jgi:3-hydroxyisobutyrate dehydrogenase
MSLQIAFIGVGTMGDPMVRRLIAAGHHVTVYNRTPTRCAPLVALGARAAGSPREAARGCGVILSMVSDSADVEEVLLGPAGAVHGAEPGALFIDMSTIAPEAARRIGRDLRARGMAFLDAPVTGGDVGAREGTLSILVGGDEVALMRAREIFAVLGRRVTHCGGQGAGQTMKACNQVLVAVNLMAVVEAFGLAQRNGLPLQSVVDALSGGAGNSFALERLGPRIAAGDFGPGFSVRLLQKDLRIVQSLAVVTTGRLEGVASAQDYFSENERAGETELGIQAMFRAFERLTSSVESEPPSPSLRPQARAANTGWRPTPHGQDARATSDASDDSGVHPAS